MQTPCSLRAMISIILVLSAGIGTTTKAAFEFPIEAPQPIVTEEGIFISAVSYVKYYGSWEPGYIVPWVVAESCVIDELGNSVNRNAANLLGIRADCDRKRSLGDTMYVFMDLASLDPKALAGSWSIDRVVEATVECVLTAASACNTRYDSEKRARVELGYIHLEIRGSAEYKRLGGTFSFKSLGVLPRQRSFQ